MDHLKDKLKRILREDLGATAALAALFLTTTAGMTSMAVDLGMLYTAKAQLQNAADAAALAAANTMIGYNQDGTAYAQTGTALSSAVAISGENQAIGVNVPLKAPAGADFVIGFWDSNTGGFDPQRTGMTLNNPDDLNSVQVKIRRDNVANTPVPTFFAGIVGISSVGLSASSAAFLGYPAQVPAGSVDLPIAVISDALTNNGQPNCGESLTFHSNNDQNSEWTTFFTWPANNPNVDKYVTGELQIPELKIGDEIYMTNGNLSNGTFSDLKDRFDANAVNGHWVVTLPVISSPGMGAIAGSVVGFCSFDITEVRKAPFKDLTGSLKCQMVIPNTPTGGANFGSRASASRLIR